MSNEAYVVVFLFVMLALTVAGYLLGTVIA